MRNYEVGSVLVRHELGKGYALLEVEKVTPALGSLAGNLSVLLRHEDGHRECLGVKDGVPIERALFGYRVVTGEELAAGFVEVRKGERVTL